MSGRENKKKEKPGRRGSRNEKEEENILQESATQLHNKPQKNKNTEIKRDKGTEVKDTWDNLRKSGYKQAKIRLGIHKKKPLGLFTWKLGSGPQEPKRKE